MNFITDLSLLIHRKKAYNAIFMIIDRFFKIIKYIFCTGEIDALKLVERMIE